MKNLNEIGGEYISPAVRTVIIISGRPILSGSTTEKMANPNAWSVLDSGWDEV